MDSLASAPAWVVYGVTGAGIGAVLAIIGYGLQKAGFGWGRFLVVLTFAFTGPMAERVVRPALTQITWSDAQTRAALLKEMPLLLTYLETEFPDDYETIISAATLLVKSAPAGGPPPGKMADIVGSVRKKYAPFVKFADDASLVSLLDQSIGFHQLVLERAGATTCGKVAMIGATALMDLGVAGDYSVEIDEQARSLFQAVRGAIDHPVSRAEATDADWEAVGSAMAELGASGDHFAALEAGDANNPMTCPALILFMRAMNADGISSAVRASFLLDATAS